VRQAWIANRYDKMEPKKQEAMQKEVEGFLNRNYDDVIAVHVSYRSNVREYNRDLAIFWQTHWPEGSVPQQAFLTGPKGQKVTPIRLISSTVGAQEFELIFPRVVEGEPLLEPGDKGFAVEFVSPAVGQVDSSRVFVEFKADKMVLNGKIAY